jgi:hypothetical protein
MGQLSNRSVPLYMGRWFDRRTGKVRTLPKPNYVYNSMNW